MSDWPPLTDKELTGLEIAKALDPKELVARYSQWSEDFYCAGFLSISGPKSLLQFLEWLADPFSDTIANRDLYDYEQELVDMVGEWPSQPERIPEGDSRREAEIQRQREWLNGGFAEWVAELNEKKRQTYKKLRYEVRQAPEDENVYQVGAVDDEGVVYLAEFLGWDAKEHAEEYARFKNGS